MNRLITLCFSHYNEKARWALEHCAVPFEEHRYMPGFSSAVVAWETRGRGGAADRGSTKYSTPALQTDAGHWLCDSSEIARFAALQHYGSGENPLFPSDEVSELVDSYSNTLGPYTRLLAYWHVLRHPEALQRMAQRNVGARQASWFVRIYPLMVRFLREGLNINQTSHDKAMKRLFEHLDRAAERLQGRDYLYGDAFSAADLTFAAMVAPVLLLTEDEGYGAALPKPEEMDDEVQALVHDLRAHPAGEFVLRIYKNHRRN